MIIWTSFGNHILLNFLKSKVIVIKIFKEIYIVNGKRYEEKLPFRPNDDLFSNDYAAVKISLPSFQKHLNSDSQLLTE